MNTEITEYVKVRGWIYYDANCRYCTALARRFRPLLGGRHFELLPLQTAGLAERLRMSNSQLLEEMRVLRPNGQCFGGADALLEIARDFWWAWPLRLLGRVPAVRRILRAGYRWIAQNRSCAGGCEIESYKDEAEPTCGSAKALGSAAIPASWAASGREKNKEFSMNREEIGVRKTLPHPGPLPLGEGESPSDDLIRRTIAVIHGPNACEKVESGLSVHRHAGFGRGSDSLHPQKPAAYGDEPSPLRFFGRMRDLGSLILPLLIFPAAALLLKARLAPWVFMWAMAFALYWGCKWLTYREAVRPGLRPGAARAAAYLLAWPGMDAGDFLDARKIPTKPHTAEWIFAAAKMSTGVIFLWLGARLLLPEHPMLAGWTGMTGVVFILHFGFFHLLSLFWRQAGITAKPLMQNPLLATSLAEFWGRRWNTAFNELAFQFTFRPLRQIAKPATAMLLVFGLSGLIHELVISLPAGGGYGLPTLYFLIQGIGSIIERSRFGRAFGLGRGPRGWFFTLCVTVAPVYFLFHPRFIAHVILPMLTAIGAT